MGAWLKVIFTVSGRAVQNSLEQCPAFIKHFQTYRLLSVRIHSSIRNSCVCREFTALGTHKCDFSVKYLYYYHHNKFCSIAVCFLVLKSGNQVGNFNAEVMLEITIPITVVTHERNVCMSQAVV